MGCGLLIAPLYTAELSPSYIRGRLVTFCEISINVGILLGYTTGLIFKGLPDEAEKANLSAKSLPTDTASFFPV